MKDSFDCQPGKHDVEHPEVQEENNVFSQTARVGNPRYNKNFLKMRICCDKIEESGQGSIGKMIDKLERFVGGGWYKPTIRRTTRRVGSVVGCVDLRVGFGPLVQ